MALDSAATLSWPLGRSKDLRSLWVMDPCAQLATGHQINISVFTAHLLTGNIMTVPGGPGRPSAPARPERPGRPYEDRQEEKEYG